MKILLFLLIPVFIFSQTPDYPDTLYLKSGQIHPCLITKIEENLVKLIYRDNMQTSAGLNLLDKIYLEEFKIVYENDNYNNEFAALNMFVSERNTKSKNEILNLYEEQKDPKAEKKWSFGILYVPYYYGVQDFVTLYSYPYPQEYLITIGKFESMFESHFSYRTNQTTSITFDIGYNSTYRKLKTQEYDSYYGTYTDVETIDDMVIFALNFGLKFYLSRIMNNNATGYIQIGLGKQFASVDDKTGSDNDNKTNEFLEDVNSPFLINLGFGAEYFFNEALSLNASLKFVYLAYSGNLEGGNIDPNSRNPEKLKSEYSEIVKRVGLGVNFYF